MMRGKKAAEKWATLQEILADEETRKLSSRRIGEIAGVSDKFVKKVRVQLYPEQTHVLVRYKSGAQYLRLVHKNVGAIPPPVVNPVFSHLFAVKVNRMLLGDAIYRLDDDGFGWRVEYMEFEDMEAMEKKYLLYYRDHLIGKLDIRGEDDIRQVRRQIVAVCTKYGFTSDNSRLVYGGAVTPSKSSYAISRATSFKHV